MVVTRALAVLELAVTNVILLYLYWLVSIDLASRLRYWQSIGFEPTTSHSVLTFVLSAVGHGISIPGLLTFDWSQFLLLLLVAVDLTAVLDYSKRRAAGPQRSPEP